jgi:bacterioferritin-associated ferredoxin
MILCQCKAVREHQVRCLIQQGACTRAALARACGAGSDCGGCRPVLDEILAEEKASGTVVGEPEAARARQSVRHTVQLALVKRAAANG